MTTTYTNEKGPEVLEHLEADVHINSAEDHMNSSTVAPTSDNRAGLSLKQLRESHGISIATVAALAGTGVNYLTRVEDGLLTPANTFVARVTYAICRLMKAPIPPCAKVGCLNVNHNASDTESNGWHTAYEVKGDEWAVTVDWFDLQDSEWKVYGQLKDEQTDLTEEKVEAFYDAWQRASAYARTLNRSGYVNEVR